MTTINLIRSADRIQVFGEHVDTTGTDGGHVFACRTFTLAQADRAEMLAKRLMDLHNADHFHRTTKGKP